MARSLPAIPPMNQIDYAALSMTPPGAMKSLPGDFH
jgi:hypothetical protein